MLSPRWRKALRDLWLNRSRTSLVVAAIAIGVFGIAAVADAYAILPPQMAENYARTIPASATLWTDPLDEAFVQTVRERPEIADAEARRKVVGRIQIGPDEWKIIWLFVIRDFNDVRLDRFTPEAGTWPPVKGEILLERGALSVAHARIGDSAIVKIPEGPQRSLKLVGTAHAPGLAPAWMEGMAYGFITPETLEWLGGKPYLDELKITVAQNAMDEAAIRQTAYQLKAWLEQSGRTVYRIEIPKPGEHPHVTQMASFLYMLGAFGLLALVLSGFLVANTISALLAQQIRQIGVMKAVGGRTRQIMGIYFGMVLFLGGVALAIAMPLGMLVGRGYAQFVAEMLNFEIFSDAIPLPYFVLQAIIGLLIPIVVAAYPIYQGSRLTVREAITDYGVGQGKFGRSVSDRLLGRLRGLPRPFMLSVRNTFRRTGRLLLTLGPLAAAGVVFMAAMNISASLNATLAAKSAATRFDLQFRFSRSYPVDQIEQTIRETPGVLRAEAWGGARAVRVYADGTTGNSFDLIALPAHTELMTAGPLIAGRWLQPGDQNKLVINQTLLAWREADLKAGDVITLSINRQETSWQIVGIMQEELITGPTAYANNEYFAKVTHQTGYAANAVVVTQAPDPEAVMAMSRTLEQKLANAGLDVYSDFKLAALLKALEEHFGVLYFLLMFMSMLVATVGGLGLISSMSLNVLERTREIGVMRATGAGTHAILRIVVTEGALIGGLSWMIAVVVAWPVSAYLSYNFGLIMFEAPLVFAVSPLGVVLWLGLVVGFAIGASFYPAWNASRLPVREALAYE
ncbi:ABC transporter permease YtrF [Thermoflexales bacterium]|nr:ABC transporter permease YtrF [Thermoflexales bacterium]